MFWKNLGRKIFKDKRHVGITLFPTSRCDTGCAHCIDSSNCAAPIHFTRELAETITSEARKLRWQLSVLLTGGGEPLMTPELIGIADTFGAYKRLGKFGIVTSGFTDNEPDRREQFETLLQRAYAKRIMVEQSFNLYHPSFPERLENTARLLMNTYPKHHFTLRACMSLDNLGQTQDRIGDAIRNIAKKMDATYIPVPLGWQESDRRLFPAYENRVIGSKAARRLEVEAHLTPQWHAIKTKDGGIIVHVQPIPLEHGGRGASITERPWAACVCDALQAHWRDTCLIVTPDGSVYPECSCWPTVHMRLGTLGKDSLEELVRRKDVFSARIMRAMLADNRMCTWGTQETCTLCKQIVAERGIALR